MNEAPLPEDQAKSRDATETPLQPRALRLKQVLAKTLSEMITTCTYDSVATCFPNIAKDAPKSLTSAHAQTTSFLQSSIESEFSTILNEKQVLSRLNEFDTLIDEARRRQKTGQAFDECPVFLSPKELIQAHLYPIHTSELSVVEKRLADVQEENDNLLERTTDQRSQINEMMGDLEFAIAGLGEAVAAVENLSQSELQNEIDYFMTRLKPPRWIDTSGKIGTDD